MPGRVIAGRNRRGGTEPWRPRAVLAGWTLPAIALAAAVAAVAGTIGPDARWLGALGRSILERGAVPDQIPFAAAPSTGWNNVPVLAELIFRGLLSALGDRGLLAAQVVAATLATVVIARDARRLGATSAGTAVALGAVVVGGVLAFAGIRAQLFSLVLFPTLVALLRADERSPSRRIWLLVPLVALWSNLHGAALLGLGLALLYLLAYRFRRRAVESAGVAVACGLALCATPTPAGTPGYYVGVITSEAAARGYGLWAPLSLHSGFDLLLGAAVLVLLAGFVWRRPRPWQLIAAAVLVVVTVHAARNGIWLLMFLAAPAATALRVERPRTPLNFSIALVLAAGVIAGFVRGPLDPGASPRLIATAIAIAHGGPILAEPAVAEQIAEAGGRVWISNPLDAFRRADQRLYLDWLQGRRSGSRALRGKTAVVVGAGSPADRRLLHDRRFAQAATDGRFRVFTSPPS